MTIITCNDALLTFAVIALLLFSFYFESIVATVRTSLYKAARAYDNLEALINPFCQFVRKKHLTKSAISANFRHVYNGLCRFRLHNEKVRRARSPVHLKQCTDSSSPSLCVCVCERVAVQYMLKVAVKGAGPSREPFS